MSMILLVRSCHHDPPAHADDQAADHLISRQGFTDFPRQQPQLSPTGLCMNYKGEVPEKNGIFTQFDAPNLQAK
jgi:hypothetical protein